LGKSGGLALAFGLSAKVEDDGGSFFGPWSFVIGHYVLGAFPSLASYLS
jgi:hypothetical protein